MLDNRLIVSDDPEDLPLTREAYLKLLYSNPVGCRLTAGISTNYLELKTIYLLLDKYLKILILIPRKYLFLYV